MINALVLGLVSVPFVASLGVLLFARRCTPKTLQRIVLITTGLATLCALALFPFLRSHTASRGDLFTFGWLPGTGQIGLYLADTGLTMALVTSATLFLTHLFLSPKVASLTGSPKPSPHHPFSLSLCLFALSAANIAFLSSNFLGRYVALEIVGLCIALAPLLELSTGMPLARTIYLALRVGDAGFLAAILLLMQATGTLNIAAALEAGAFLASSKLNWAVIGFLLAVWVKVGAWPFHSWLISGQSLTPTTRTWLYGIVMPNLGLYLLYRITPLLTASGGLWGWVFWLSVGAMGMAVALSVLWRKQRRRLPVVGGALLGGIALGFAALGMKTQVWWLAVGFAPLQVVGQVLIHRYAPDMQEASPVMSVDGLPRLAQSIRRIVEVGVLERLVTDIPHATLAVARWLHRVIEQGSLESALRGAARAVLALGYSMQRGHTGRLRYNLMWVVVGFVVTIVLIVTRIG